jgi:formate-dependent nitrite reductase membrane component NrfD
VENRPVPLWTWEIPVYFFVGGAAGAAALVSLCARFGGADPALVRDARWLAAAGAAISPLLLISDLGRPGRFLNMLRVFKLQSPMSIGVWTLIVFSLAVGAGVLADLTHAGDESGALRILGLIADTTAALAGLVLATYTGVLIGATVIPVWVHHAPWLPLLFGATALGSAVSLLELFGHVDPSLNLAGLGAAAMETVVALHMVSVRRRKGLAWPLRAGRMANLGTVLTGPVPFVLRLLATNFPVLRLAAALGTIGGALMTRFGWMAVGRSVVVLIAAACLTAAPGAQVKQLDLSPKALAAKASKYVTEYTTTLRSVIAEETYIQETYASREVRTGSRRMRGDMYLVFLPADREWMAIHDIIEVDGQPVTDRQELRALIASSTETSVIAELARRHQRYNIGTIGRSFNEPTLPLLIVDDRRLESVKFSREPVQAAPTGLLVTLTFEERKGHPTIVHSTTGAPIYSTGEIVIDPESGRIHRTRIAFKYNSIQAELSTTYALEPKIGLWVPSVFTERYEGERNGLKEIVICSARYTNYQRFETSGRIKR